MAKGDADTPASLGPGAAIGAFIEQSIRKLPPSAYAGLAGVAAFFLLIRFIPAGLPDYLSHILQNAFVFGAVACCWPIIRGVYRNK